MSTVPGEPLRGWWLPPGLDDVPEGEGRTIPGGPEVRLPLLEEGWAARASRALRSAREVVLRERTAAGLARTLGRVGRRFLDPADPLRKEALRRLPEAAGLSGPMSLAVLDGMAADWTEERLLRLLAAELGDAAVLDGFRPEPDTADTGRSVRATGPALSLHVAAGNVPGVGTTSMIRSLLVKSAVVAKPALGDVLLPVLWARGLAEEDPALARAVAVVYWPGGSGPVEGDLLREADAVIAYGSDETVRSLRRRVPVGTRFVAYPHRVSVGVVGREALTPDRAGRAAASAARAVALFDQRGCVSPHVLYVEEGGEVDPDGWCELLAGALDGLERELPGGPLLPGEASELHQLRGVEEMREAAGEGVRVRSGGGAAWTVILDPDPTFRASCLNRVVRVTPVAGALDVTEPLGAVGGRLQSVGVAGLGARLGSVAEVLAAAGAVRIAPFERIPFPPAWWHHDGRGPLRDLLRWTDLEGR